MAAQQLTQSIAIYSLPYLNNIYQIKMINKPLCEFHDELPSKSNIYYIQFNNVDIEYAYACIYENLFDYAVRTYQCFKIYDINDVLYDLISTLQDLGFNINITNGINDTLKNNFILRLKQNNIYDKIKYKNKIETFDLNYPENPETIFQNFTWNELKN